MITQKELKRQLNYNKETGIFTRLISNSYSVNVGDIAGYLMKTGYVSVSINNKAYLCHRLAYLYVNGYMPKLVDHIDRDKTNNAINNLRPTTRSENILNSSIGDRNSNEDRGIWLNKKIGKDQVYKLIDSQRYIVGSNFLTLEDARIAKNNFKI